MFYNKPHMFFSFFHRELKIKLQGAYVMHLNQFFVIFYRNIVDGANLTLCLIFIVLLFIVIAWDWEYNVKRGLVRL